MVQRKEPSLKSKIYLVIVFVLIGRITTRGSVIIKVRVGREAQLDFPYPCDSTVVTLQHANARPFYRSADPHYKSLSSNQNLENYTETGLNQCFLNLTINPVSRNDEGTYILTAYKNGVMLPDYPRIGLRVNYLPGKASCELSNDYNDGEWVSLQCTAPVLAVGTLPGQIVCYQNGTSLPKGNKLRKSGGNLIQVILARFDGVVYCCSSILNEMKDKCDCTDWRWDPVSDSVSDIADPCPAVVSTEDPTSTIVTIVNTNCSSSSNLVTLTAMTKYPENRKNTSFNWILTYALTVSLILAIVISLSIKHHCKVRGLDDPIHVPVQVSSITPENEEPCLSVNGEEVEEDIV